MTVKEIKAKPTTLWPYMLVAENKNFSQVINLATGTFIPPTPPFCVISFPFPLLTPKMSFSSCPLKHQLTSPQV